MKLRSSLFVAVAAVVFAGLAGAQSTPSTTLLALSKQDHTLAIPPI